MPMELYCCQHRERVSPPAPSSATQELGALTGNPGNVSSIRFLTAGYRHHALRTREAIPGTPRPAMREGEGGQGGGAPGEHARDRERGREGGRGGGREPSVKQKITSSPRSLKNSKQ